VALVCSDGYARISVGHNPWSNEGRVHNIAALCEKYGGGGHASVGGISLPGSELPRAREIANLLRTELMMPDPA
jgi:nanoRNase/pAp phosphatase (c-di-AMP/oligoRNAs hydrolase)